MSETSHSVGRIAVLTAFTLVFAAAWSGDAPQSSRLPTVLASTRRESGSALGVGGRGAIADGLLDGRMATDMTFSARTNGQFLGRIVVGESTHRKSAALFSGTPALLGRSTPAVQVGDDTLATASAPATGTR